MRLIDADEFERRIKKYDTTDYADKALYNFALHEIVCMPTVDVLEQIRAEIEQIEGVKYEVSDNQGKRYKYETIEKSEALQIIDKYTK